MRFVAFLSSLASARRVGLLLIYVVVPAFPAVHGASGRADKTAWERPQLAGTSLAVARPGPTRQPA